VQLPDIRRLKARGISNDKARVLDSSAFAESHGLLTVGIRFQHKKARFRKGTELFCNIQFFGI
jgi:hypothetical protein